MQESATVGTPMVWPSEEDDGSQPTPSGAAQPQEALPPVTERTRGMQSFEGLLPLWWSREEGRLFFEVPELGRPLLYYVSLPGGLGSNRVGLDRAQIGDRQLVEFRRVGGRVLLVAPNLDWRSSAADPAERAGVRSAFAMSVLWAFEVEAQTDERLLVDGTEFFGRDAHGVARKLAGADQGSFTLDASRTVVLEEALGSFPQNSEIEVLQTFTAPDPGTEVRATTAVSEVVSLRVRHSFLALPDLDQHPYRPRTFDPRSGYFAHTWRDFAAPIDAPLERQVLNRHHLDGEHPIVYHVDRAAPEPVRTALLEGARYWSPVFAAAGFPGGFRVELLPEGADPQDARYNVITWVDRSTRGWSYGDSVSDPRTGEILKGHVSLGALRVRRDVLLFEALLAPYGQGGASDPRVIETALARIRQLAAHEVGHTLGLAHNFAASADGRASVMDYPAPLIEPSAGGGLDLSDAYRPGCGEWDELAIRYGYGQFGEGAAEARGLAEVLARMERSGLRYMSDRDARGSHCAHPLANLWDNGADPVARLAVEYQVRARALAGLGVAALKPGRPLAELEGLLVAAYLHHRYQLEAAARQIGGLDYRYALSEGGPAPQMTPVPDATQRAALARVLTSLDPEFLRIDPELLALIPPAPPGHGRDEEDFQAGGLLLDPLAAAAACAELSLAQLLDSQRAARLIDQSAREPARLSFEELVGQTIAATQPTLADGAGERALRGEVRSLVLEHLMELARAPSSPRRVQTRATEVLWQLHRNPPGGRFAGLFLETAGREALRRFFEDPLEARAPRRAPRIPPGPPIGCSMGDC